MKKRVLKTLLSTVVCVSMLGTTCLASSQIPELDRDHMSSTITGDSTVENPIYKVSVPTSITFAVDPFEQKNQSQIYSQELQLINKSNVPVKVTATVKVVGKVDSTDSTKKLVTVVDAESKVTETNANKIVYIAAEIPSAVTETAAAAAAYPIALKKVGDDVYDATKVPSSDAASATDVQDYVNTTAVTGTYTTSKKVTVGETDTELVFALAGATYQSYYTASDKSTSTVQLKSVAADKKGSAVFRFCGKVNTKAAWAAGDLTATVTYDLIGLTGTNYNAVSYVTGAHAYVASEEAPTFTAAIGKITYTKGAGDTGLASITKIEASWGGTFYDVTNQIDDDGNGTLTIKAANLDAWGTDPIPTKVTYTNRAGTSVTTEAIDVTAKQ